jgi:hypothetical protein
MFKTVRGAVNIGVDQQFMLTAAFTVRVHQYIVKYNKRVIFSSQLFLLLDILRTRFCLYSMILYKNPKKLKLKFFLISPLGII